VRFVISVANMILVAAAGPALNIILAVIAALSFHLVSYLPDTDGGALLPRSIGRPVAAAFAWMPYPMHVVKSV